MTHRNFYVIFLMKSLEILFKISWFTLQIVTAVKDIKLINLLSFNRGMKLLLTIHKIFTLVCVIVDMLLDSSVDKQIIHHHQHAQILLTMLSIFKLKKK